MRAFQLQPGDSFRQPGVATEGEELPVLTVESIEPMEPPAEAGLTGFQPTLKITVYEWTDGRYLMISPSAEV